jgi:bifunctional UDP-N-acetylglucosamine pyrophosphorylase/glucosamine-1-phosphate N-acetyltransferase
MRVIIPAAGEGKRLHATEQNLPKVMHELCGKPLLEHVLAIVDFIERSNTYIIVGDQKERITSHFGSEYRYVEQRELLGTGHAVMMCADAFEDYEGSVLVTFGDMPLFRRDALQRMCKAHEEACADCTVMTAVNPDLKLWARIVRDGEGEFAAIVEGKDCTPEQLKIKELFSGVLVFHSKSLFEVLPTIGCDNAQHEYYLTEVPERMAKRGMRVKTFMIEDGKDLCGVNTMEELKIAEAELMRRTGESANCSMGAGVEC